MSLWILAELIFLIGIISFLFWRGHYLSMLISLELVMLSLYNIYIWFSMHLEMSGEMIFLFITMVVCEAAFGLALVVFCSRGYGSDMSYSFMMSK